MSITFIVLTHNNQTEISGCLHSLKGQPALVVDDNSADKTLSLVKTFKNIQVLSRSLDNFSSQRNFALSKVKTDWAFFLDADERLSAQGLKEILGIIKNTPFSAFRLKRLNYFFGKPMKSGGYWPDWQTRLFKVKDFSKFTGLIHETPIFKGDLGDLTAHLIHHSHKSLSNGLNKSIAWTKKEAQEFIKSNHPSVTWWRVLKVMVVEFINRYFLKKAFLSGYIGFTESLTQAINRYFVYQQIWELQQKPSIKERYQQLDKNLK